jgi:uncharacterized protein YecT (DUF1311 family)
MRARSGRLVFLFLVTALDARGADSGASGASKQKCPPGAVWFKSRCVQRYECCDPALCPPGTVLQNINGPECVPCAQAEAQQAMNFCAAYQSDEADKALNALYREVSARYPSERTRLKVAQRAWIQFRDKLCDAFAGTFEGGSMQSQVRSECLQKETHRQIDRLKELQENWAGLAR